MSMQWPICSTHYELPAQHHFKQIDRLNQNTCVSLPFLSLLFSVCRGRAVWWWPQLPTCHTTDPQDSPRCWLALHTSAWIATCVTHTSMHINGSLGRSKNTSTLYPQTENKQSNLNWRNYCLFHAWSCCKSTTCHASACAYVCRFVGSCLATIGNLPAMGRGWVIIK